MTNRSFEASEAIEQQSASAPALSSERPSVPYMSFERLAVAGMAALSPSPLPPPRLPWPRGDLRRALPLLCRTNTVHFLLHGVHHKHPLDSYRLVFPPALTIIFVALVSAPPAIPIPKRAQGGSSKQSFGLAPACPSAMGASCGLATRCCCSHVRQLQDVPARVLQVMRHLGGTPSLATARYALRTGQVWCLLPERPPTSLGSTLHDVLRRLLSSGHNLCPSCVLTCLSPVRCSFGLFSGCASLTGLVVAPSAAPCSATSATTSPTTTCTTAHPAGRCRDNSRSASHRLQSPGFPCPHQVASLSLEGCSIGLGRSGLPHLSMSDVRGCSPCSGTT